jgi:hypothetical protein
MFVSINIYFRPYEFLAVYQCIPHDVFMTRPDLVYIRVVK